MEHICKICNKQYASYHSLWIHNKRFHKQKDIITTSNDFQMTSDDFPTTSNDFQMTSDDFQIKNETGDTHKSYNACEYCGKFFTRKNNMNYHIKNKCKEKDIKTLQNSNNKLESMVLEIKNDIKQLKNYKPTTKIINKVNGNIINGNNTETGPKMIIYKTGTESMDQITYGEVSTIFDNEISSVIKLIELVNFSENKPENHSFCSTALESPYLSFYNTDTNTINKERKTHFFEEVICKSIQNHEILYGKFKNKFNLIKRKQIEENISNLKAIKDNSFNSKIMSELIRKLNLLSYNKRELIQDTWDGKTYENESDEEFMKMLLDDDETQRIIKENKNKLTIKNDSDDEERPILNLGKKKSFNL